jgi:hypothetical protein
VAEGTPIEKFRRLHASVVAGTTAKPDAKLETYLENVRHRAATITEADVADLLAAGHSQDAVFEATAGAALGAALERFEAGLRALEEVQKK